MLNSSAWDDIQIPNSDLNVRQVAIKTAVPCFWGKDSKGHCLFIIELQGDHTVQYLKNVVIVNGINIDLRSGENGKQRLILMLEEQVDRDLFEGLCLTLSSSLENASDSSSSLAVAQLHIRRWKAFLAGSNQRLSPEMVRGIFAEVTFLLELLNQGMIATEALNAWLGPERSHQDFIFYNTAVEIKSLSGSERSKVRISSEDQLESLNDNLFLRIYRLSNLNEAKGAHSLNELINSVYTKLNESEAIEVFEKKLIAHGYAPIPDYEQPLFVVSEIQSYFVDDTFPKLVRSKLPQGITSIAYDIKLEAIETYSCSNDAMFREIL